MITRHACFCQHTIIFKKNAGDLCPTAHIHYIAL